MIDVEVDGGVTIVTLNRPDKANALTADMLERLCKAFHDSADQNAVILTGVGRVFSAGADLDAARSGLAVSPLWEELSSAVASCRGLTVAALNGTLAGGAFGMALACDLRIAVPEAKFFYPVMKLGFLPQPSDPIRLRAIAGLSAAKRILLAGEKMLSDDALRCGLLDGLAEDGDVLVLAHRIIADARNADIRHVNAIKSMI